MSLPQENTLNFGRYKGRTLSELLRDRKYCQWLLQQDWFQQQHEYLYNRVKEHKPLDNFLTKPLYTLQPGADHMTEFLDNYPYFHLRSVKDLTIFLSDDEKKCYQFYLDTLDDLENRIVNNIGSDANPFNIKAPTSWLNKFEKKYGLSREAFKSFLAVYDLPNLPYIVEDIKRMGGLEYKGAKSFLIAKERSLQQEKYWEGILKGVFNEHIQPQYVWKECIYDFICIKTKTLYECKLGLKDFDQAQYEKYKLTLGVYSIVYLIGNDCIVDISRKTVFTTNPEAYTKNLVALTKAKGCIEFGQLIRPFDVKKVEKLEEGLN